MAKFRQFRQWIMDKPRVHAALGSAPAHGSDHIHDILESTTVVSMRYKPNGQMEPAKVLAEDVSTCFGGVEHDLAPDNYHTSDTEKIAMADGTLNRQGGK